MKDSVEQADNEKVRKREVALNSSILHQVIAFNSGISSHKERATAILNQLTLASEGEYLSAQIEEK
jgi:hypothetical protein